MVVRQQAPPSGSSSSSTITATSSTPSLAGIATVHADPGTGAPDEIRFVSHLYLTTKYRRAPVRFRIEPSPRCCDSQGRVVCSPGSYIEGNIVVQLAEPLAAMQLKLVFRACEHLNYDAMAWGRRVQEDPLFSVYTVLWGISAREAQECGNWPIMEPGSHLFPFACQMPDVNYPSALLDNPLVQYRYNIIASIERPGHRPFQTEPCPVFFSPAVAIEAPTSPFQDDKPLGSIPVSIALKTAYMCNGDDAVRISCVVGSGSRKDCDVYATASLEQHFKIVTSGFHYSKTIIVRQVEQQRLDTDNDVISLSLQDLPPSMDYGRQIDLRYMVRLVIKSRQGTTLHPSKKKRSYLVPVTLATLPVGSAIDGPTPVPYSDPAVADDSSMHMKPKFLRMSASDSALIALPAYDAEDSPPEYCEQS